MANWKQGKYNPYTLVGIKDKKKNGYPYGYITLNNKVYKVSVVTANKEGVDYWVKLEKTNFVPSSNIKD